MRVRTGTMEFMAIEVFLRISHTCRHNLESFFSCSYLAVQCAQDGWSKKWLKKSLLAKWHTDGYQEITNVKLEIWLILEEFPPDLDWIKPLCLFPTRKGDIFTGTLKNLKFCID